MLGLVLSLIVSVAPALAPSASVTCPDDPASCDADAVGPFAPAVAAEAGSESGGYATPAVIDCPMPVMPSLLQALVGEGECDGTPRDASYRASRFPESERNTGTLTSSSRQRERRHGATACRGVPRDGGDLTVSAPQPLALFALPDLPPASGRAGVAPSTSALPFRVIEPPDRPPAA